MNKDPIIRIMTVLALVSVLGLVVLTAHHSLQSPYPLTVARTEFLHQEQNSVKYENNMQNMKEYVKMKESFSQKKVLPEKDSSQETKAPSQPSEQKTSVFPMDINQATAQDLMQVEGIGEKRAQSILDYRQKKGTISSMKDLLEIDGIGEVLLGRLSEKFYVG